MLLAALALSLQLERAFDAASAEFDVPVSILKAVAHAESRFQHLVPNPDRDDDAPPPAFGIMGLHDDPYFGSSLGLAAALIDRAPEELKNDPALNIRGAAALLHHLSGGASRQTPLEEWEDAVVLYSGIPQPEIAEIYTYEVFSATEADLEPVFGQSLAVLSAPRVSIADSGVAIWNPATVCNFRAGRTEPVTHIAEHIMEGTYAGTISWFKNCASQVSAHYLVRSSDGQITQMVHESDTGWHVKDHNGYTIGIEHEGYANNCEWYTTTMFLASAALTRDIADRLGIPRTSAYDASLGWDTEIPRDAPWKIKGHTNFPTSKTCPGPCFDWARYRLFVIDEPSRGRRRAASSRR